ncbi:hypothetical protein AMS68_005028 [Peltaster fructicola]|uniref:AB hydrolase-1 domain-containing protein n=1 Tax=Peltaster fructicola TaxID=286661 RepID=A0A6H0XXW9_9PEZI|nr:hypothetical protein AMS68_005028 [Peltaster fructicola]
MPNAGYPSTMKSLETTEDPVGPGQQRPYPKPDKTDKLPFQIPGYSEKGDTVYKLWGDLASKKTPLICLHGGPGMAHNYILPICLIAQDFGIPVIMYDQIGCGLSTHFPERKGDEKFWTPQLFMAELDNLKSTLGITDFDLLGQSWGGMLGGQYAITQPKGLRKLIIADSPASMVTWVEEAAKLRKQLPQDVQDTLTRCEKEGKTETPEYEAAVNVYYTKHLCRIVPFPDEIQQTLAQVEKDNTVYHTMNGPSEFHVIGSLRTWNIEKDLKKITHETVPGGMMVINGYFDEATDICARPFFTEPQAKVKWTRYALSGHCPHLEETERYVADLGAFLLEE